MSNSTTMPCPYCRTEVEVGGKKKMVPGTMKVVKGSERGQGVKVAVWLCGDCNHDVLAQVPTN